MEANDLLASHETKESSAYADVVDVRDNFICLVWKYLALQLKWDNYFSYFHIEMKNKYPILA